MDALWIWIHHNPWIFWLPAAATLLAGIAFFITRKRLDWRAPVNRLRLPIWTWPLIAITLLLTLSLILDPTVRDLIYRFVTFNHHSINNGPLVWIYAILFSLIGLPLILKGLAFGWLRRLFTSAVLCPKCNYDLASLAQSPASTPITCPECGSTSPDSQSLRRHPKRKRLIIIGSCLILAGLGISASRINWNSTLHPIKSWAIRTHANLTGDLTYWMKQPSPLSPARSLERFDSVFQAMLSKQPPPPGMLPPELIAGYFTHSRPLDLKLDQALSPLELHDQILMLRMCKGLLAQSAVSKSRAADVAKHRLSLDAIIDRFFNVQGLSRSDLNPDDLIAEYRNPATPSLTKAAIITLGSVNSTNHHAFALLAEEPDPRIRQSIRSHWLRLTWDEPALEFLIVNGATNATLHRLLTDGFQTREYENYFPSQYQRPLTQDHEARLLALLEADDSPLFSLPADTKARAFRLRSIASYMQANHLNPLNSLHGARWQVLINELNTLANSSDPATVDKTRPLTEP